MEKFFKIVPISAETDECTIACGYLRATEKTFKNENEAKKYIQQKPWDLIFTLGIVAARCNNSIEEEKKDKENTKNK